MAPRTVLASLRWFAALVLRLRPGFAADTSVFSEQLDDGNTNDSGYRGLTKSGALVSGANGGWQVTDGESQLRYDIDAKGEHPGGLACGSV